MQRLKPWLDIAAAIAAVLLALAALGSIYVTVNLASSKEPGEFEIHHVLSGPALMLASCVCLLVAIRIRVRSRF